jgi:hypothetical protein
MSESLVFDLRVIDRATAPLKAVQDQVTRTAATVNAATSSVRGFSQASGLANTATQKWAKGALQQAGYQVGDFAVQLANGTNGLQAFGQQAPQLLQIFGPAGAVIGAVVAVVAALGVVAQKSGREIENLGSVLGVLQAPVSAVVASIKELGSIIGSVFGGMSGQIDTVLIFVGLLALRFAALKVAAMISAAAVTASAAAAQYLAYQTVLAGRALVAKEVIMFRLQFAAISLTGTLKALGAAMMRLLPIALLLGLAKLVELFLSLKEGAGGFGEAMKLLGDLVKSVFVAMGESAKALPDALSGVFLQIKSGFMLMVSDIAYIWSNMLVSMGNAVEGFMPDLAAKLQGAATRAMSASTQFDTDSQAAANESAAAFAASGDKVASAWGGVSTAWQALKAAVAAGTTEVNIFGDASAEAADKAGGAAKAATEELTRQQENMKAIASTIRDSFSSAFMSMVDGTKSVKNAFKDMARNIILKLYEVLVVQQMVNAVMGVVGKAFPALAPYINTAAMGGPVTGGKPVLVGERGPELMVPSRNAQVIPNNQLGGGGVTVVQNINVSTGVQQTVRAEIKSLMPQIADSAKAAVLDAKRRGGAYGGAFA